MASCNCPKILLMYGLWRFNQWVLTSVNNVERCGWKRQSMIVTFYDFTIDQSSIWISQLVKSVLFQQRYTLLLSLHHFYRLTSFKDKEASSWTHPVYPWKPQWSCTIFKELSRYKLNLSICLFVCVTVFWCVLHITNSFFSVHFCFSFFLDKNVF